MLLVPYYGCQTLPPATEAALLDRQVHKPTTLAPVEDAVAHRDVEFEATATDSPTPTKDLTNTPLTWFEENPRPPSQAASDELVDTIEKALADESAAGPPAKVLTPWLESELEAPTSKDNDGAVHAPDTLAVNTPTVLRESGSTVATATHKPSTWFDQPTDLEEIAAVRRRKDSSIFSRVVADHQNFYSPESLTLLGGGLVVGAAIANSSADRSLQHIFQSGVQHANSDEWFESLHASKELGNGVYTLPIFVGAWGAGELLPDSEFARVGGLWGERSLRGFLVGAPPLIALQQLTGGSRPTETSETSEWHPLADNNGISGHSFMGSLPCITAAKMSQRPGWKASFYAASAIAPLSRVNDNAHYPSQVALGWWMAYLAASAVEATDHPDSRWKFYPYATGDHSGMLAEYKF